MHIISAELHQTENYHINLKSNVNFQVKKRNHVKWNLPVHIACSNNIISTSFLHFRQWPDFNINLRNSIVVIIIFIISSTTRKVLASFRNFLHSSQFMAVAHHLLIPSILVSFRTPSFHLACGIFTFLNPSGFMYISLLGVWISSILVTWPAYCR